MSAFVAALLLILIFLYLTINYPEGVISIAIVILVMILGMLFIILLFRFIHDPIGTVTDIFTHNPLVYPAQSMLDSVNTSIISQMGSVKR